MTVYNETKHVDLEGTLTAQTSGASTTLTGTLSGTIQQPKANGQQPGSITLNGPATFSVDVTNTGDRFGAEVVQLYVKDLYASVVTYDSVLRGFEKVYLKPGETKRVAFMLGHDELAILDRNMRWTVEPGEFEIRIGSSSEDIRSSARAAWRQRLKETQ